MKYLRKIIALVIAVVFLAALVISLGLIFSVRNVNVTIISYADDYDEAYKQAKQSLDGIKGESLVFLDESSVIKAVEGSNYSVEAIEKKFPCTVNVTIKERVETFSLFAGGLYYMYDSDGVYLNDSANLENINSVDGSPNVELKGVFEEQIKHIAGIALLFKQEFKSLRSIVASIELKTNPGVEGYIEKLFFNIRSGVRIEIYDYNESTDTKIKVAYSAYCTLSDRQKLSGTIRCYRIGGTDGLINADYSQI